MFSSHCYRAATCLSLLLVYKQFIFHDRKFTSENVSLYITFTFLNSTKSTRASLSILKQLKINLTLEEHPLGLWVNITQLFLTKTALNYQLDTKQATMGHSLVDTFLSCISVQYPTINTVHSQFINGCTIRTCILCNDYS